MLFEDLKENLESYSYKVVNEKVKEIVVDKENYKNLGEIINLLKSDKRKNVTALGIRLEKKVLDFDKELNRVKAMYDFDRAFGEGRIVAGVDEVGRGPLAGPIVSAAVILDLDNLEDLILEINDSKLLSEGKREILAEKIKEKAVAYSISFCTNEEIDEKGIAFCNNNIFIKACDSLKIKPQLVLSDGYLIKNYNLDNKHVIKGDRKSASIACASIVAKVYRDNLMKEYAKEFPFYDFEKNMGYGTKSHIEGLKENGPCTIHRKSFLKNLI
ncbi:MAG: ribonuclease HII [Sarcina sp.]